MKWMICVFKGHKYKKSVRLMVLDDSWPPNYIGKSHQCEVCGHEKNMEQSV